MKIKASSWHYRFIAWGPFDVPVNLCAYCRCVVWTSLVALFLLAIAAGAVFLVLSIPLHWFFRELQELALVAAILLIACLVLALMELVRARQCSDRRKAIASGTYQYNAFTPKEPGLIYSYLQALHDKVCPLIEFDHRNDP